MSATHPIGHLHFRHIQILGTATQSFTSHSVLQEGSGGDVRRREPEGHVRSGRLLLVGRFGLHLLLPFDELLQFLLVVLAEVATDGLHEGGQLTLVAACFGHQVGHHAARLLPTEVGVLEFCAADMGAKYGEKHRNQRFMHIFRGLGKEQTDTFCPVSEVRHLGCRLFCDIVSHCIFAF